MRRQLGLRASEIEGDGLARDGQRQSLLVSCPTGRRWPWAMGRHLGAALVHESETCRRILRFGDLVQAPIAKDSGRPSFVIRLRMLQAITASAFCDLR